MTCLERPAEDFHGIELICLCSFTCVRLLFLVIPDAQGSSGLSHYLGGSDLSRHREECVTLHQA